ncbi:protein NLP3 isoform X2 [Lolium perenne]|nr:protein NLP3-like isoform X2 [Lolium perenne]
MLVQVWAPTKNGDRYMLTTSGQPFVLDQQSIRLLQYRAVSMGYAFPVDGDNVHELGLPGRVYRQRIPEWTPDVQYYSSAEYRRLNHAINNNVHGTVALPVFHPSVQSCVAVVELIMTSKKVNYASEVDKVCKALEAVNLKSTDIVEHPYFQICNEGRHSVLVEILEILTVVCEELKLPIGQTWVPCKHQSLLSHGGGVKKSCSSFDGSCMEDVCISTSDVAFHVTDACIWGFRDACVAHHLQKGQGVPGKAFISRRPCFSKDVSRFSKMEYPLVHYARMFGLAGCFSICLQSAYTGDDDYILEFFLPPDCREDNEQKALMESIMVLLRQHLRSLQVASDKSSDEAYVQVDAVTLIHTEETKNTFHTLLESDMHGGIDESDNTNDKVSTVSNKHLLSGNYSKWNDNPVAEPSGSGTCNSSLLYKKKNSERRRGKPEKTFSLEVIQQYFSGSLKSAAKSLGVCPTTLKRICRQHGISNWPSRQIGKVNRSISRLQKVIEAAQGSESAFNVIAPPVPVPVNLSDIEKATQNGTAEPYNNYGEENRGPFSQNLQQNGCNLSAPISSQTFLANNCTQIEEDKSTNSRSSSGQHSTHSHTSEGSFRGSLGNRASVCKTFIGPQQNLFNPEVPFEEQDQLLSRMLLKDSVRPTVISSGRIVTVKARYNEDILRFRFPCSGSVSALKDEVAKRIPIDVGNFVIKYLDDDHEWVNLTCDADLEECMEIYQLSGTNVMRLLVADTAVVFGSSCGSTA